MIEFQLKKQAMKNPNIFNEIYKIMNEELFSFSYLNEIITNFYNIRICIMGKCYKDEIKNIYYSHKCLIISDN